MRSPKPPTQSTASLFSCLKHLAKRQLLFHCSFLAIGVISLVAFIFFFSFLADSYVLGIFIAFFFFALVLYFVLRLYFQEQKPAQLLQLRDEHMAQFHSDPMELAEIAEFLAKKFDNAEVAFYSIPKAFEFLRPQLEKVWRACHWQDVHLLQEQFLRYAIDQKIKLVTQNPADPQMHAELASSYLTLAEHFQTPNRPSPKHRKSFERYSHLGLVELEIVSELMPNDLWVHTQLAQTYQSLGLIDKAINQYETLLKHNPDDVEAHLSLGSLYFKQGMHGKGLKIYERLQKLAPLKAKSLLACYGTA